MSFKQRDVTGGEQLWGAVPGYHLMSYLLRIISVPAETFLRYGFGKRYYTIPNFIAGWVALLMFNYAGVIIAGLMALFGHPIMGGIGLLAMGTGPSSEWMAVITKLYLLVGTFHLLEEWTQWNVLRNLRHTFSHGSNWLLPVGKRLMTFVNFILQKSVRAITVFLPDNIQAKVKQELPNLALSSNSRFTERFLEPMVLFFAALIAHAFGETTVGIWLMISIPGLNLVTSIRHSKQMDAVYDLIDNFLDAQDLDKAINGEQIQDNRPKNNTDQRTTAADLSPELMDMLRKNSPTVAQAIEAEKARRAKYQQPTYV